MKNKKRNSIRLKEFDYSAEGAYFVTICVQDQKCIFGKIIDGRMELNDVGMTVEKCWNEISKHFHHVKSYEFIVMPNHVHGILFIIHAVGAKNLSPLRTVSNPCGTSKTIGSIIRGFKIGVTKWMRCNNKIRDIWQRNYYEHIIRNENDLNSIREYIMNNPQQWEKDEYYC